MLVFGFLDYQIKITVLYRFAYYYEFVTIHGTHYTYIRLDRLYRYS